MSRNPIALGRWTAVVAAALFGVTLPLVGHWGRHSGPFATATLLYAGAALGSGLPRRRADEAPLGKSQAPRLLVVALFGAVLAPAALAWGLQRSGALAGSLLLNLEALFTVLLAALAYLHVTEQHRHLHRHEALEHDHAHRHDDGHHEHHHALP